MSNGLLKTYALALTLGVIAGCATGPVERVDPAEQIDLTGRWNDTDSRLVADAMVSKALSDSWVQDFSRREGHKPVVIVGRVYNRSREYINVDTFIKDIERELMDSGRVEFVASSRERKDIRSERKDQDLHASEETRNEPGRETAADFMLKGDINTLFTTRKQREVRYYQIDLSLISIADNRKVWTAQKKIKKFVEKPDD